LTRVKKQRLKGWELVPQQRVLAQVTQTRLLEPMAPMMVPVLLVRELPIRELQTLAKVLQPARTLWAWWRSTKPLWSRHCPLRDRRSSRCGY
jgi:hypothetical protein